MLEVLGNILPLAVAVAVSPLPIIAVILMLMSPRSGTLGIGFLAGWFTGILAATTVVTLLADLAPGPTSSGGPQPVIGVVQLILGVLLVLLGIRQWRSRPAAGQEAELPSWMSKIDSMGLFAALGLAFALAAINPKNLLVAAAAGTVIGKAGLGTGGSTVAVLCFTVMAALTVAAPVLLTLVLPQRAATMLSGIRTWLTANNATIMTVVFIILGAQVIGKGLGSF